MFSGCDLPQFHIWNRVPFRYVQTQHGTLLACWKLQLPLHHFAQGTYRDNTIMRPTSHETGLRTWNYDGSSTEQADGHNSVPGLLQRWAGCWAAI
jgi:hypothetical protein